MSLTDILLTLIAFWALVMVWECIRLRIAVVGLLRQHDTDLRVEVTKLHASVRELLTATRLLAKLPR